MPSYTSSLNQQVVGINGTITREGFARHDDGILGAKGITAHALNAVIKESRPFFHDDVLDRTKAHTEAAA